MIKTAKVIISFPMGSKEKYFNYYYRYKESYTNPTGEYEIFFPDYRPISDYTRYTISSNFDYDLTDRIRLSGA